MKKVCVVTAARSEYGLMRWIIDGIHHDKDLELQLVVTGAHLLEEQGFTYRFIEEDGYPIAAKVDMHLSSDSVDGIAKSMGYCSMGFSDVFKSFKPDIVIVLGDRYELVPIVSTALIFRIPVAHIGGGDVTEGAIDDEVRNAITMMATLHFPGVEEAYNNICRMRGSQKNNYLVGEPGLDSFFHYNLWSKIETAKKLNLNVNKKWCLVTLHPETKLSLAENVSMAYNLYKIMCNTQGIQFVISKANVDLGGPAINDFWASVVSENTEKFHLYSSLGQICYLSMMKHAALIMGNSSSGIIETPLMGTPVVNIGNRQKGRHMCSNIISCGRSVEEIQGAMQKALISDIKKDEYWGDGHSSNRICSIIKDYLYGHK